MFAGMAKRATGAERTVMASVEPVTELDRRFSSDDALPTTWSVAREGLEQAQVFWLRRFVRMDDRT
jgi:hypothetical protein